MLRILECNLLERDEYELTPSKRNIVAIYHAIFYLNIVDFWKPSNQYPTRPQKKNYKNISQRKIRKENLLKMEILLPSSKQLPFNWK